jgi:hypothetical protein
VVLDLMMLRGSEEGTTCCITNNLIKNMEGVTIKWCMSRRHEACPVYMRSLQNMVAKPALRGAPLRFSKGMMKFR